MTLSRRHLLGLAAGAAAGAAMPALPVAWVEETGPLARGSLLHGALEPESIGVDGDFYVDIITNDVWHRVRGTWKLIFDYAKSEAEAC